MSDVDKVRDLLRKRILSHSPDDRVPVKVTPFANESPRGILYSDGKIALFENGRRVFNISGIISGEYSMQAILACQVLLELELISYSEAKSFKLWIHDESRATDKDYLLRRLEREAGLLGYELVRKE